MEHYIDEHFLSESDRVSVLVVGCGGTGSKVLTRLCALNHALEQKNHPGLNIVAFDGDVVTEANLARQDFAISDLGQHKSTALITKINRYYGHGWDAVPAHFNSDTRAIFSEKSSRGAKILITCVDSAKARLEILNAVQPLYFKYWLDFGNSKGSGQVVLGTLNKLKQPESDASQLAGKLPHVFDLFPNLLEFDETDDTPSCSLPEALQKQSLFINSIVADYGCHLLSTLFFNAKIKHHGLFVHLDNFQTSPIPISLEFWERLGWSPENQVQTRLAA